MVSVAWGPTILEARSGSYKYVGRGNDVTKPGVASALVPMRCVRSRVLLDPHRHTLYTTST